MNSLDELIKQKSEWTLLNDSMLQRCLEETGRKVLDSMKNFENFTTNLENDSELLKLRLEKIHNNIYAIKATKLVDEKIVESPVNEGKGNNEFKDAPEVDAKDERMILTIQDAVQNGFQLVDENFKELTLVGPDFYAEVDPNFVPKPIFEVKDPYVKRRLPPIIGSAEFYANADVSLKQADKNLYAEESADERTVVHIKFSSQAPSVLASSDQTDCKSHVDDFADVDSLSGDQHSISNSNHYLNAILDKEQIDEKQTAFDEGVEDISEMSKPVLEAVDANFLGRLTSALKNKSPAISNQIYIKSNHLLDKQNGDSVVNRPVSVSSIPLDEAEKNIAGEQPESNNFLESHIRSRTSSVSTNAELGPSSVASRIAQIGNKIPIGPRKSVEVSVEKKGDSQNIDNDAEKSSLQFSAPTLPPSNSSAAVISRAKGPTRRAPTNVRKLPALTADAASTSVVKDESGIKTDRNFAEELEKTPNFGGKMAGNLKNDKEKNDFVSEKESTIVPPTNAFADSNQKQKTELFVAEKKAVPNFNLHGSSLSKPVAAAQPKTVQQKSVAKMPQKKSIFDSSTSDEDDFLSNRVVHSVKTTTSTLKKMATSTTKTITNTAAATSRHPSSTPVATNKNSLVQPKKKGLFDDSDSDI